MAQLQLTRLRLGVVYLGKKGYVEAEGTITLRPFRHTTATDQATAKPLTADIGEIVDIPPGTYLANEICHAGIPRYITVPPMPPVAEGEPIPVIDYADLPSVDPDTLDPILVPEAAWWAALEGMGGMRVSDDPGNVAAIGADGYIYVAGGSGLGNMNSTIYDPNGVYSDAFDLANQRGVLDGGVFT